jgi:purine-binding chemotaxis protein CheW
VSPLAITLPVEGERYALDITAAREIVPAPEITSLPGAPASVLGLFNLRGDVIPLFDTAALADAGSLQGWTHAIVVETTAGIAALAAGGIPETVALTDPVAPSEVPWIEAAYALDRSLILLLDIEALLAPARVGGKAGSASAVAGRRVP